MKFVRTLKDKEKIIEDFEELENILRDYSVKLAYLFGSYSHGKITKFSDIDIGIVFKQGVDKQIASLRVDLTELLEEEEIDLIDLEKAPPRLKYNIIKEGKILLGEKHSTEFEIKAIQEYLDFKPLEEKYFEKMKKRIESGKFGR